MALVVELGPAELAWLLAGIWWTYRRVRRPVTLKTGKAQLFNAQGRLDSVRVILGSPPATIVTNAGTYHFRHANGPHWMYRA